MLCFIILRLDNKKRQKKGFAGVGIRGCETGDLCKMYKLSMYASKEQNIFLLMNDQFAELSVLGNIRLVPLLVKKGSFGYRKI